jgi:hypothetical protein
MLTVITEHSKLWGIKRSFFLIFSKNQFTILNLKSICKTKCKLKTKLKNYSILKQNSKLISKIKIILNINSKIKNGNQIKIKKTTG